MRNIIALLKSHAEKRRKLKEEKAHQQLLHEMVCRGYAGLYGINFVGQLPRPNKP